MENIITEKPLILLIGPSGSGKTTLANVLSEKYGMTQLASYTDRPMRSPDETGHTFVSKDEFDKLRPDMAAYNIFDGHQYGATYRQLDAADIYVVDIPGFWDLMHHYRNRALLTFCLNAAPILCARRMKERGDSEEKVRERIQHDRQAFAGINDIPAIRLDAADYASKLAERICSVVMRYIGYNNI